MLFIYRKRGMRIIFLTLEIKVNLTYKQNHSVNMEESPIRRSLGCLSIVAAVVIGIVKSSFLWGIGVFLAINFLIAPILNFLEKQNR